MTEFPPTLWGTHRVTFEPAERLHIACIDRRTPVSAALALAIQDDAFVVADIPGRGWCVPGGHLEPGETPAQAAEREAFEEAGIRLAPLFHLGSFLFQEPDTPPSNCVPVFLAAVVSWHTLPAQTESRGRRLLTYGELPQHYYRWDPLLASVFAYAVRIHLLRRPATTR